MESTRLHDAEIEALQGAIIAGFQTHRLELASSIFDSIPNAHLLSATKLARILPFFAWIFKIATPARWYFDSMDDIVQDLAQALKEEALRRITAGLPATVPFAHPIATTAVPPTPPDEATKQYARFIFSATALGQMEFDDLTAWHDSLSNDDRRRLYDLVSHATAAQLAALVTKKISVLRALIAQVQQPATATQPPASTPAPTPALPQAPPTFMQFRMEVTADPPLTARVNAFLTAKNIAPLKFWKAVEDHFARLVKDKAGFVLLMNLTDDEIIAHLGLDFNLDESVSRGFDSLLKWAADQWKDKEGD
jgi:hypothetical protein